MSKSPISRWLDEELLEHTLLLGYYGGGNYGDELLLEVMQNLLVRRGIRDVLVGYRNHRTYTTFHHDAGYSLVDTQDKRALLGAMMRQRNIVIGGGGLWGMDVNPSIFVLSLLLFLSRWIGGKRIHLVGVGYYNSTSVLGRISAWLAANAARTIIARDEETYQNFVRLNKRTVLDKDLAWRLNDMDLAPYEADVDRLAVRLKVGRKTLFITLRRFRASYGNNYTQQIADCLAANRDKPIILALMEPKKADPEGYEQLRVWQRIYRNVRIVDFSYNPVVLLLFFRRHRAELAYIGPQFHGILIAYLAGIPFLPIAYDNKVAGLLAKLGARPVPIRTFGRATLQGFVDNFYGGFE